MPSLTLALSHPQSVARFEAAAEELLCAQGFWDETIEVKLRQQAESSGLHALDVELVTRKVRGLDSVQEAFAEEARKRPHEKWFELVSTSPFKLAIIVDNSDSSWPYADAIAEYARELEAAAQAMGTVQFWAWGQPTASCASAINASRGNASLFAPVWNKLKPELETGTVTHAVVLGAGRLFDIEDFANDEAIASVRFVPLAQTLTDDIMPEYRLEPAQLLAQIMAINASCSIGSEGAVPLWWDDPAWAWNGKHLEFKQENSNARFGLRSAWLCADGQTPNVKSDVDAATLQVHSAAVPFSNQHRWQNTHYQTDSLPDSVTDFRLSSGHEADAQDISPLELAPEQKGWLWLSFSENPASKGRYDVQFCVHPTGAVVLQESVEVALLQSDGIHVYRFRNDRWESRRLSQSHLKIKENIYALAL